MEDLKIDPLSGFKNFSQISCQVVEYLLNAIGPKITIQDTSYRKCLSVVFHVSYYYFFIICMTEFLYYWSHFYFFYKIYNFFHWSTLFANTDLKIDFNEQSSA